MEALNLNGNSLKDDGAIALSNCIHNIDSLSLCRCRISGEGVTALAEEIKKRKEPVKLDMLCKILST